ncbi:DUF5360 family protein [Actinocrispum wychmicini]|uniref:Uncharacterized protein n=1 Tax=Actinocrispum wychmicini TaxID=1213861 RepID=A0A4R2JPX4_9PSEU|nr:DUF5360 family protein [Actinocrispum wychmicini]TCO62243.1 hypothetical protein EV192_102380 [Actinocrispum wychmicini]
MTDMSCLPRLPCLPPWRLVRKAMLGTDIGFLIYWTVVIAGIIPPSLAYQDYLNPILTDWNKSFLLLDVLASLTGLIGVRTRRRVLVVVSLVLTSTAGLQAVSFWLLRGDFTLMWWLPNLWLLLFPLPAIVVAARHPSLR